MAHTPIPWTDVRPGEEDQLREIAALKLMKAQAALLPELVEALEALAHYFEPLEVGVPLFNNLPRLRETVIKARAALAKAEALMSQEMKVEKPREVKP